MRTLDDIMHSLASYPNLNLNLIVTFKPEAKSEALNDPLKASRGKIISMFIFLATLRKYRRTHACTFLIWSYA